MGCTCVYGNVWDKLHESKPAMLMILVQFIFAAVNILYKLAANDGMNLSVLVGYRFMFGAGFIVPIALVAERNTRPKMTWKIVAYGFLCGLFGGSLGQNLYLKSMVLTSATFVAAMTNLIPAITFVLAISLRLEKLGWRSAAGKAKIFGTVAGIGGAMLLTFYKGLVLNLWNTNINLLETTSSSTHIIHSNKEQGGHFLLGATLALAAVFCYSLWLIIQAKVAEKFPCPYSITAMMTFTASVQGVVFALCVERDWNQWKLGWDIKLLAVAIAGILGSGLMFTLVAWCVRMKGPLFVSVFQPLMLLMVALGGSMFLDEKLHLGMLLGGILIVCGLYLVLWGKGREMKKVSQLMPENVNQVDEVEGQNGSSHGSSLRKEAQNGSSHGSNSQKEGFSGELGNSPGSVLVFIGPN